MASPSARSQAPASGSTPTLSASTSPILQPSPIVPAPSTSDSNFEHGKPGATVETLAPALVATPAPRRHSRLRGYIVSSVVSTLTLITVAALALAPLLAFGGAIWASIIAISDLVTLYTLVQKSQALVIFDPHAVALLDSLETAERVGFLALAYLALLFALMTLMGGLLGRRWGRLYILPGVVFTLTAMAAITLGLIVALPLFISATHSATWFAGAVIYALIDAPLVSAALIDTRLTRTPTATGRHKVVRLKRKAFGRARDKGAEGAPHGARPSATRALGPRRQSNQLVSELGGDNRAGV